MKSKKLLKAQNTVNFQQGSKSINYAHGYITDGERLYTISEARDLFGNKVERVLREQSSLYLLQNRLCTEK